MFLSELEPIATYFNTRPERLDVRGVLSRFRTSGMGFTFLFTRTKPSRQGNFTDTPENALLMSDYMPILPTEKGKEKRYFKKVGLSMTPIRNVYDGSMPTATYYFSRADRESKTIVTRTSQKSSLLKNPISQRKKRSRHSTIFVDVVRYG